MARLAGVEPATAGLEGRCSIQLSYRRLQTHNLVGAEGFEPPTPCSQSRCATRLRYAPRLKKHSCGTSRSCFARRLLPARLVPRLATQPWTSCPRRSPSRLTPKQVRYQTALCPAPRSLRGFPARLRVRAGMIRGVPVSVNFNGSSWSLKPAMRQCRRTQVQRFRHASPVN
jgi:hypothetical protein